LQLFKNYRFLKQKLKITRPDTYIYNATPNSYLDVFPTVQFDEIKFT